MSINVSSSRLAARGNLRAAPLGCALLLTSLLAGCGGFSSNPFQIALPSGSSSGASSSSGSSSGGASSSSSSSSSSSGGSSGASGGSSSGAGSSSSGVTAQFWIPYTATPNGSGGQSGLFVIPSASLGTAPAFVNSSAVQVVGRASNLNVNSNGLVTASSPGTLMFVAADSSNLIHVYGLNLANASSATTAPTATQIGNLSLTLAANAALSTVICPDSIDLSASTNILDPTKLFVVLHIAGTTGCNTTGDTWEVVHYSDSATTPPAVVTALTTSTATPTYFKPLYQSSDGALTSVAAFDPGSGKLQLYADASFTNPTTLVPAVTALADMYDTNTPTSGPAQSGTTLFFAATTSAGQAVYRLPQGATTATQIYTVIGTLGARAVADDNNVYFTDTGSQSAGVNIGPWNVTGTITLAGTQIGSVSGNGTSALDTGAQTLTITGTTVNDETMAGAGQQQVGETDVFTGTYANGTFTATGGTYTFTSCQAIGTPDECPQVTLNATNSYRSVSGSVGASGGTLTTTRVQAGIGARTDETYTFSAGSGGGVTNVEAVLQEPLAGGTPQQILASSSVTNYQLLGSNNALLALYTTNGNTSNLYTIPANASSAASSVASIGNSAYTGAINTSFLQQATVGDNTTRLLFLNVVNSAANPATYASEVLSLDGTVKQPLTNNSAILQFAASPWSGAVIQVQNMGGAGFDGGTFYNVSAASLNGALSTTTPLTMPGGSAYAVPAGTAPTLVGVSNSLSGGSLLPSSPGSIVGLGVDLTGNLIVPISIANTSITLAQ